MSGNSRTLKQFVTATAVMAAIAASACATDPSARESRLAIASGAELSVADAGNPADNQLIALIRQATAQYHRLDAAIADGYVQGTPCEGRPGQGIGIHYRKASLFDANVDPSHPEVLIYEPKSNGDLELAAVEYVVPAAAWDPTHHTPPMLGDRALEDRRVPVWNSPPFPSYVLHVWAWKHNPDGLYNDTNPSVSCDAAAH